eukprot:TRINITY_DN1989_c0_g1_i7.p1 TRINITY_DN1989_c0_g1~~TRINITY_DN1989_c0_g1_i7.p1  ORF type:complete len:110 (-),score=27.08 TRINITY_DN1989_c0_g1_i7:252-581(-)
MADSQGYSDLCEFDGPGKPAGAEEDEDELMEKRKMEELKGFIDLGFDFSNPEKLNPRLQEVVPALKTLSLFSHHSNQSSLQRKAQSDAAMKKYLKQWARSVAVNAVITL